MARRYCRRGSSDGSVLITLAIIAIVALPVIGMYKIFRGDKDDKLLGTVLMGIGLTIWIAIAIMGN